jgi:hypothetical protein
MAMTNVKVSLNDLFAETCLSWEANGFRYHIWVHDPGTLYKNPPLDCEHGKPGYFRPRKLDATAVVGQFGFPQETQALASMGTASRGGAYDFA